MDLMLQKGMRLWLGIKSFMEKVVIQKRFEDCRMLPHKIFKGCSTHKDSKGQKVKFFKTAGYLQIIQSDCL